MKVKVKVRIESEKSEGFVVVVMGFEMKKVLVIWECSLHMLN